MSKKKISYSKHALRRRIEQIDLTLHFVADRLRTFETILHDYIEMQKNDDEFQKFLDDKYKQEEGES